MPDPIELKECPFCGQGAHTTLKARGYRVECIDRFSTCHMNMRTHHCRSAEEAATAWNNRIEGTQL